MTITIVSRLWMMSLQACALILIVLLARRLFKKYPKIYSYCLWILVGARLLCPVFIEAPFSLQPDLPSYSEAVQGRADSSKTQAGDNVKQPQLQAGEAGMTGQSALLSSVQPEAATGAQPGETLQSEGALQSGKLPNVPYASDSEPKSGDAVKDFDSEAAGTEPAESGVGFAGEGLYKLLAIIYLAGVGIFLCVYLARYLLMKHWIALAVREQENVWLCERVEAPFVIGVLSPKIILPYSLSEQEKYHVLRHERTHIRHHDPLIRLAGVLCICLHWWNPLVWLAVHKMNQDMEMFCDEAALCHATAEDRKAYAKALLSFAAKRSGFSLGLAFGESNTEKRVRNIMRKRKGSLIIILLVALLATFCACAFMTSPKEDDGNGDVPAAGSAQGTPEDQDNNIQNPNGNQNGSEDGEHNLNGDRSEGLDGNQIRWDETSNVGTWKITDYAAPGIYAMTEEEISGYIGSSIVYAENYFRLGTAEPLEVEGYREELVTAREFDELYRVSTGELGISGIAVNCYEAVGAQDAPFGSFFYQIDYDNALIFCDGVFFRAVREETQGEDTNSNPVENGTEHETAGGTESEVPDPDREAMLAAYTSVLESFYFDHTPPDGESYGFWEGEDVSGNRFALYDIDGDGKDELIVEWTTTYNAGNVIIIYGYDAASNTVRREFEQYPFATFYDNGIVKIGASHNHGRAPMLEDFWPYTLYQYDPDSDSYIGIATVDAWEREPDEFNISEDFPEEADADGDGVLYYVMQVEHYDYDVPCDLAEYNKWLDSYVGGAEKMEVPYMWLTEENINGIK